MLVLRVSLSKTIVVLILTKWDRSVRQTDDTEYAGDNLVDERVGRIHFNLVVSDGEKRDYGTNDGHADVGDRTIRTQWHTI